jgi:hypothetical protein
MLPRQDHRFGFTWTKPSLGSVPAGLTLASDFGFCFQCQRGSSLVLHRPIEITGVTGHVDLVIHGASGRLGVGISLQTRYQGVSISCSFPDRSLFRLDWKVQFLSLRYSPAWSCIQSPSTECAIFPVSFADRTEFGGRKVRTRLRPPPPSFANSLRSHLAREIAIPGPVFTSKPALSFAAYLRQAGESATHENSRAFACVVCKDGLPARVERPFAAG